LNAAKLYPKLRVKAQVLNPSSGHIKKKACCLPQVSWFPKYPEHWPGRALTLQRWLAALSLAQKQDRLPEPRAVLSAAQRVPALRYSPNFLAPT
jgi:hypothetical protein